MSAKNDIKLLKAFLNYEELQMPESNRLTGYSAAGAIFSFTNESLKHYYERNLEGKKVLSVTSSGDHILHAIYAGATDITGFDINRFCKYYAALKIAMIKHFNFYDFMDHTTNMYYMGKPFMCYNKTSYLHEFEEVIDEVSKFLTESELEFWNEFININKKNEDYRGIFLDNHKPKCNIYYDSETYLKLRSKLFDINLKYVDCGIDKLGKLKEKYDFAYISNIISHLYDGLKHQSMVFESLYNVMKQGGRVCIPGKHNPGAFFDVDGDVLNHYFDKKTERLTEDFESERIILTRK